MKAPAFLVFLGLTLGLHSQGKKLDSLLTLLRTDAEDSSKVNHLNGVARITFLKGDYDTSLYYSNTAIKLAEKIHFKKGQAAAYSNTGIVCSGRSENAKALEVYEKALKIDKEIGDKAGMGKRYSNMGVVYKNMGDYRKALELYLQALKIGEELGDKPGIATRLANIGIIYKDQGDFPKALDHYLRALKIDEEIGNKQGIAKELLNIGNVYHEQADYTKALTYYLKSRAIAEEISNKSLLSSIYGNIGNIYNVTGSLLPADSSTKRNKLLNQALEYYFKAEKLAVEIGEPDRLSLQYGNIALVYNEQYKYETSPQKKAEQLSKAIDYYNKALVLARESDDLFSVARNLGNMGILFILQKKYKPAFDHLYAALALDDSLGAKDYMMTWYGQLSALYEYSDVSLPDSVGGRTLNREEMRLRSLYYHKKHIALRDTLFSVESRKQLVQKEMNYEFEKKEAIAKVEQDKKDAIAHAEARKQQVVMILISFVLLLVGIVAVIIFRSLKTTRKQKALIEEQKNLVEEKQREILDSIHYAKRIQTALITNENYIQKNLLRLQKN